jgi:1,4-alpha-glucan branching enzyme
VSEAGSGAALGEAGAAGVVDGAGREAPGFVALVLHAHLPWVRHPEHGRSLEERWLFEALWESYLPLLGVLDRLAADGVRAPLSLSLSPTLLCMLGDALLRERFADHLRRTRVLAEREAVRLRGAGALAEAAEMYRERLQETEARWEALGGELLRALVAHADAGRLELMTTAASHAYLPGLLATPSSVRAQLRLGCEVFERATGRVPLGFWLPECAYHPRLDNDLAAAGVRWAVLDAHALTMGDAPAPRGTWAPVLGPSGVAFFARDVAASHQVWSRAHGFPGDPVYRDFYRDVGHDLDETALGGEIGPDGHRLMTGLKYWRITGGHGDKEPYRRGEALARAREHAAMFVGDRERALGEAAASAAAASTAARAAGPPISVAPYDAELFGHWWFEGPEFLEAVLRELDARARDGGIAAVGLGAYLERYPRLHRAEPAASTWGEGGFGAVWTGPRVAPLWRHVHHAAREVEQALARGAGGDVRRARALEQAVRELLLLEASDWPFMIHGGDTAQYAEARMRRHRGRVARLVAVAHGRGEVGDDDARWVEGLRADTPFLEGVPAEVVMRAFERW